MKEFKQFGYFVADSIKELFANFKEYKFTFFVLLFLEILSCTPWESMGFESNSLPEIINSIIIALASLVVVVNIVLIDKKITLGGPKEKLLYAAPTYLIYTFYSSILFFVPLVLFFGLTNSYVLAFIPGIFIGVCLAMVPVSSICINNDGVNYFKHSLKLVRRTPLLIFSFFSFSILLELAPLSFNLIVNSSIRLGVSVIWSIIETFLIVILAKVSVKIFFMR